MAELKLRDYQRECIDAVFKAWSEGVRRPAVVLPTGAGKTVVFSALVDRYRSGGGETVVGSPGRVIVLAHRDELVDQAIGKLRAMLPEGVSVGKVKAEDNDVHADVMVCSVQTLASARRRTQLFEGEERVGKIGLIITDECHHAAAASYKTIYAAYPDALNLGVTATLGRGDGVGLGSVWDDVVYERSILWMISKGYLCDVRAQQIKVTDLDLNAVGISRGDYRTGDLGEKLMEAGAMAAIPAAYQEHAKGRPGVVFTPTVATAQAAAEALNAAGVNTAVISGETPRDERRRAYEDFRTGRVQVLSNCMVLTEGFDAPWAEVAVIARPTQSAPLYTQMVGRVLRTYPGKTEALVLDLVGASSNKLRTIIDLEPGAVESVRSGETLADAVVREAEEANRVIPAKSLAFSLKAREVDMFAGSKAAWHRTDKGVLFIDAGQGRVVLWPSRSEAGAWRVCYHEPGMTKAETVRDGLDLSAAMAWGEVEAEDRSPYSTAKSARWRKQPASEAQIIALSRFGVDASGMTKGEASEAISVAKASRVLDRWA